MRHSESIKWTAVFAFYLSQHLALLLLSIKGTGAMVTLVCWKSLVQESLRTSDL